jgi:hypothetical protein
MAKSQLWKDEGGPVDIPWPVNYPGGETVFEPTAQGWAGEFRQHVDAPATRDRYFADGKKSKPGKPNTPNRGNRKKNYDYLD